MKVRASKRALLCPLCDGRLPVFGLAAVVIKKEGATGAAASGVSWISVT